jgi:hypothetical protein
MKINENIALAKSILRKSGIEVDSDEYKDYLKIRDIVGKEYAYIGILTRLRFVDNVVDIEELKSIYDVLKNSKLDIGKLNRMSYDQILDTFYEEITSVSENKDDYELIHKDETYSFFRVHTYKGILEIGSPAWCLKTKSNWDNYQAKYPEQWVAIENRFLKRIITPNNYYLGGKYVNSGKTWVRFGVSIKRNEGDVSWIAHDDNDGDCKLTNHTFYGVLSTILNLSAGIIKSYYKYVPSCEYIQDSLFKITGDKAWIRLNIAPPSDKKDVNYLKLSKTYSYPPVVIRLRDRALPCAQINTTDTQKLVLASVSISDKTTGVSRLINEYIKIPSNIAFIGLRLKSELISMEEVKLFEDFINKVGKWLVFHWNENYYIVIDSEPKSYNLPVMDSFANLYWNDNSIDKLTPSFYLIDKETLKCDEFNAPPEHDEIIKQLEGLNIKENPKKKVKGFWDFLGKNK